MTDTSLEQLKAAAGLAICALFGWIAFVSGGNVPLLQYVDLGFHELGHLLTYPLPDLVTAAMGSIVQIAVPWGLALYFMLVRRDTLGCVFCLAWAATSARNVSVYVADAPIQALPLIGGEHDWAYILGPEQFDALDRSAALAATIELLGAGLLVLAVVVCLTSLWFTRRAAWALGSRVVPER